MQSYKKTLSISEFFLLILLLWQIFRRKSRISFGGIRILMYLCTGFKKLEHYLENRLDYYVV